MASRKDRTEALAARSRFRIGELLVHPDRNVVIREGEDIHLEPMWMQILVYLAEHHGRTISTQELLDNAWGRKQRDEGAVQKTISLLRSKVLLDDRSKPRYIDNIRSQGYCLIAPVAFPNDYLSSRGDYFTWNGGNPYVGLVAFDEAHADVFYGRGEAIARAITAMRAQLDNGRRFILLVGASGSGKTSLLRAGVIPKLTANGGENGLEALSIARCDLGTTAESDAFSALTRAVAGWTLGERPVFAPQSIDALEELLTGPRESIHAAIDEAFRRFRARHDADPHAHLLLTLDHAEGLVTSGESDPARHAAFAQAMQALCDHPRILATMIVRGDYYPKLVETIPALIDRKGGVGHVDIAPPSAIEINDIITLPARRAGLQFERDPETYATHHLNDALAEAAHGQADVLPLLQHTLHELYLRCAEKKILTYAAYREIGGLEGAIAQRAEAVFGSLSRDAQDSLQAVLGQLVVIESDSDAIRGKLGLQQRLSKYAKTLVQAFIEARLFATDGSESFGVAHEALLRQWPRAREWAKENQRLLQAYDRFDIAKRHWVSSGKRKDYLLNAGIPLSEAILAYEAFPEKLDDDALQYLGLSERIHAHNRLIKRVGTALLAILTILFAEIATMAFVKSEEAARRRVESQERAGYMLTDLYDAADSQGNLEMLEQISMKIVQDCEKKSIETLDARDLVNCSRAYRILGRVRTEQKKPDEARALLDQATRMARMALDLDPSLQDAINEIGQSLYGKGLIDFESNNFDAAWAYWKGYLDVSRILLKISPINPHWMFEVSYAANNLGTIEQRRGKPESSIRFLELSASLKRNALSLAPDDTKFQKEYVDTLSWISSAMELEGKLDEASAGYDTQIAKTRELLAKNGNDDSWRFRLANYLQLDASLQIERGELERATRSVRESIYKLNQLDSRKFDPTKRLISLARGHLIYSEALKVSGDEPLALNEMVSALNSLSEIKEDMHNDVQWIRLNAYTRFMLTQSFGYKKIPDEHKDNLRTMQMLQDSSMSDEIIREYAEMLIVPCRKFGRNSEECEINLPKLIRVLKILKSTKRADWNIFWAEANLLTGNRSPADKSLK